MGDKTKIEWTDASWTPIRAATIDGKVGWHCEHASEGCRFCYAESINLRLGTGLPFKPGHAKDLKIYLDERMLTQPLRWKGPRKIFVCSMTDLFASFVPDAFIDRMFAAMALAPHHTFQILTKRPDRMLRYMSSREGADIWRLADRSACDLDLSEFHPSASYLWQDMGPRPGLCETSGWGPASKTRRTRTNGSPS
jgi:protein gp37